MWTLEFVYMKDLLENVNSKQMYKNRDSGVTTSQSENVAKWIIC